MGTPLAPTLLIVAHGTRRNGENPAARLAMQMRAVWPGRVTFACMRSQPELPDVLGALGKMDRAAGLVVLPFFFAYGDLVTSEIPDQLVRHGLGHARILPPIIGLNGFLPALAAVIEDAQLKQGWESPQSSVFLVSHGLKSLTRPLPEIEKLARRLGARMSGAEINIANIEGAPSLADWRQMTQRSHTLFVPFLAGGGVHAHEDLPEMIGADGKDVSDGTLHVTDPVGEWPILVGLVAQAFGGMQDAIPLAHPGGYASEAGSNRHSAAG